MDYVRFIFILIEENKCIFWYLFRNCCFITNKRKDILVPINSVNYSDNYYRLRLKKIHIFGIKQIRIILNEVLQQMKTEIYIQKYKLKWALSLPMLLVVLGIQYIISLFVNSDAVFYFLITLVAMIVVSAYYIIISKSNFFDSRGFYWIEEDKLYVEINTKKYCIENVEELVFGDPNIFLYYYAYMQIKTKNYKLKIYGESLRGNQEFADSKLGPLCRLIIRRENLEEKKILGAAMKDCWYVKK